MMLLSLMIGASLWITPAGPDGDWRAAVLDKRATFDHFAREPEVDTSSARHFLRNAERTLEAANHLAFALEDERAIEKYQEALMLFGRGAVAAGESDIEHVAACYRQLGAAWFVLKRTDKAGDAFRRSLALSPGQRPDAQSLNPATRALFNNTAAELSRQARGALTVGGTPAGAQVLLDGRPVGALPLSIADVVPGEHWIVVQKSGYTAFAARSVVRTDTPGRLDVYLRRDAPMAEPLAGALPLLTSDVLSELELRALRALADTRSLDVIVAVENSAGLRARAWRRADDAVSSSVFGPAPAQIVSGLALFAGGRPTASSDRISLAVEPKRNVPAAVALLPFGIGQFVERRPLPGALFLAAELALLATNVATAVVVLRDRTPEGTYNNAPRDQILQIVNLTALGALVLTIVGGGVDGFLHRAQE